MEKIEGAFLFIEDRDKLIQDTTSAVYFWDIKTQGDNIDDLRCLCEKNNIQTVISAAKNIKVLSSLLYLCPCVMRYVLIDTDNCETSEKSNSNIIARMWDTLAVCAEEDDLIGQAGWIKSDTGEKFQDNEMDEFAENVYLKLRSFLNENSTILEIGVSSGIICKRIAPSVKKYYGVDVSGEVLKRTKNMLEKHELSNVELIQGEAINIDALGIENVDIVILNSVIQYFPGYNYFYNVIEKTVGLLNKKGILFIGDILDAELKNEYMKMHTKKSRDLYYSREQIANISDYVQGIFEVEISDKYGEIRNELKEYRFDALLKINNDLAVKESICRKYARDFFKRGEQKVSLKSIISYCEDCITPKKGDIIENDNREKSV